MASISTDANGNRAIQFIHPDGRRQTIRLGHMPPRAVREVKAKVGGIVAAAVGGVSWDAETAKWV